MKLYHGTWTENFKEILNSLELKCSYPVSETTELLNKLIIKYSGEDLCGGCVYLSGEDEATEAYDFAFTVDTRDLNTNLLYVADNRVKDDILMTYHGNLGELEKDAKLKQLVNDYADSILTYADYLKCKKEYDKKHYAEFLYFGDIRVGVDGEDLHSLD